MNISGNELRKGDVILYQDKLWVCLQSEHRTPGNLRAFIQAKLRNVVAGNQMDARFSSTEKLERVDLFVHTMQFLYADDSFYHFMNVKTYDQVVLSKELIGEQAQFLAPEMQLEITFYEDTPISVKLPQTMDFKVVRADPEIKGATASAQKKSCTLENGMAIQVPSFVREGDTLKINTETLEYVERVKR